MPLIQQVQRGSVAREPPRQCCGPRACTTLAVGVERCGQESAALQSLERGQVQVEDLFETRPRLHVAAIEVALQAMHLARLHQLVVLAD